MIAAFSKVPVRAIHVVPCDKPGRDMCRSVVAGPVDDADGLVKRGPLASLLRCLDNRGGLPLVIHPECVRRAWGNHSPRLNIWGRDEVAEAMAAVSRGGGPHQ